MKKIGGLTQTGDMFCFEGSVETTTWCLLGLSRGGIAHS